MTRRETAEAAVLWILAIFLIGELFYRTYLGIVPGILTVPVVFRFLRRRKAEREKRKLRNEFRDYLYAVSSSVAAGKALPSALRDAAEAAAVLYPEGAPIRTFADRIVRAHDETALSASRAVSDAAERSGIPEIVTFAEVCAICTETGGDLAAAIGKTETLLSERIETEKKIESGLAEKKLELWILVAMPVLIVAFLQFSSADYMRILYDGINGRLVMTAALGAIIGATVWTRKMMNEILA